MLSKTYFDNLSHKSEILNYNFVKVSQNYERVNQKYDVLIQKYEIVSINFDLVFNNFDLPNLIIFTIFLTVTKLGQKFDLKIVK